MKSWLAKHLRETPVASGLKRAVDLTVSARSWATGRQDRAKRRGAGILLYHGVEPQLRDPFVEAAHIDAALFRRQIRHLKRHYRIVSIEEIVDALRDGRPIPADWVALSFDDGYRNNLSCARAILHEEGGLPMTVFLATDLMDSETVIPTVRAKMLVMHTRKKQLDLPDATGAWRSVALAGRAARANAFWQLHGFLRGSAPEDQAETIGRVVEQIGVDETDTIRSGFRSFDWLRWDDVRELAGDGVTLANHTRRHLSMRDALGAERIADEVVGAHDRIQRETGTPPTLFAYPFGGREDVGRATIDLLESRNYRAALTTWPGTVEPDSGPLVLPRLVGCVQSMGAFRKANATGQRDLAAVAGAGEP